MKHFFISGKAIQIKLNQELYSLNVVYKCFYWYASLYSIKIDTNLGTTIIDIEKKEGDFDSAETEKLLTKIKQDLIDYKTREIILNETQNVRDLLIAKAFANHDDFDELPPGEISDPVGFNIEN
jgi:His-Xaa-Ser system protein HxsD